jgi:hypothetical protein
LTNREGEKEEEDRKGREGEEEGRGREGGRQTNKIEVLRIPS